jgi:hypothetical protein
LGVLDVVEVDVVVVVGFAVDGEGGGDIGGEVAQVDGFAFQVVLRIGADGGGSFEEFGGDF